MLVQEERRPEVSRNCTSGTTAQLRTWMVFHNRPRALTTASSRADTRSRVCCSITTGIGGLGSARRHQALSDTSRRNATVPRRSSGWPRSCTRPGSAAASGWATPPPPSTGPARRTRSACSAGAAGERPGHAHQDRGHHRWLRRRASHRGAAASRGAAPPATSPHLTDRMLLTLDDRRPACLTEVRAALTALPGPDQARLGVLEEWKTGRTSSPTGRSSAPSAWSPRCSARTSATAPLQRSRPDRR